MHSLIKVLDNQKTKGSKFFILSSDWQNQNPLLFRRRPRSVLSSEN